MIEEDLKIYHRPKPPKTMREAINNYYEISFLESEAMLCLQAFLDAGLGSPTQRKESRQLLGLEP